MDLLIPTRESFTSASIPRSTNNPQVSFAALRYVFPYNAEPSWYQLSRLKQRLPNWKTYQSRYKHNDWNIPPFPQCNQWNIRHKGPSTLRPLSNFPHNWVFHAIHRENVIWFTYDDLRHWHCSWRYWEAFWWVLGWWQSTNQRRLNQARG